MSKASRTFLYAIESRSRSTRKFHSTPVSRAERDRLLEPTNAIPNDEDSNRHAFGWKERTRGGSRSTSMTAASSLPRDCSSSEEDACQSSRSSSALAL